MMLAREGSRDVHTGERAELFERDFVVQSGLNAQRTHEDVRKHGAVGHGLDGMVVGSEYPERRARS